MARGQTCIAAVRVSRARKRYPGSQCGQPSGGDADDGVDLLAEDDGRHR